MPTGTGGSRGAIAAVIAVVVLVAAVVIVAQGIVRHNALQNCLDSGRRTCGDDTP